MTGRGAPLEVTYGEGWDGTAGRVAGPIAVEEARSRDAAGEPYAVVLTAAGSALPVAVLHIAWNDDYLGLWWFDEFGRRDREVDLRRLESERLFLRHDERWRYPDRETLEFSETSWHVTTDLFPDGRGRQVVEPRGRLGGSTYTVPELPVDRRWLPRPAFGDWAELLNVPVLGSGTTYRIRGNSPDPAEPSSGAPQPFGWHAPAPYSEPLLDTLFTPGASVTNEESPDPIAIEVRTISSYTVTGSAVAFCDPQPVPSEGTDDLVIVDIPSGTYPLQESVVSYEGEMFGESFTVRESYAYRLLISDAPTVSWTMAIRTGDDPRLLRDGERSGFPVDTGTGCLVDVTARSALMRRFRDGESSPDEQYPDFDRVTDPDVGAELLAFPTGGDGDVTVWIGHDIQGNVTAVAIPMPLALIGVEPWTTEAAPTVA
ncbi:DUF4241 domain-containing protein [Nocardia spumae]|uniref:DUF4241 domain-containing protein n=1 Tax=Nocardia spumae TaxID=2887190 RepID=UPI001D1452FE|nr:DUF4241 domain-containing protein [Nocardia spumae]